MEEMFEKPKPKYSIGDIVVTATDILGRVVMIEKYDSMFHYKVRYFEKISICQLKEHNGWFREDYIIRPLNYINFLVGDKVYFKKNPDVKFTLFDNYMASWSGFLSNNQSIDAAEDDIELCKDEFSNVSQTSKIKENKPNSPYEFKPFDKVLVRYDDTDDWMPQFFSYVKKGLSMPRFVCIGDSDSLYPQCIPYEGNENIAFTTLKPKSIYN